MTGPYPSGTPATPLTADDDRQWAMFAHLGGILGFLPALLIFLLLKDRGPRTREESREALNWQITWTVAAIAVTIVVAILNTLIDAVLPWPISGVLTAIIGLAAYVPYLANLVLSIVGALKVNGGGSYRYPFAVRLVR